MNSPKRNRARARVLTPDGLKKLRERIRSHEDEENAGFKYTLERLGQLTGLDPDTVKKIQDCKGSDKRSIDRCFESFGLTLEDSDHMPATQTTTATVDPNFVGRDEAIADLDKLIDQGKKLILILGGAGFGKTTLAWKYLDQRFVRVIQLVLAKERKDVASVEGLIEEKLKELGEEPGREFAVSLERLRRTLETKKIGILIDNLEPALEGNGCFVPERRLYVELLRVLGADTVQSVTLITSRDPLHEPALTTTAYQLKGLSIEAWQEFFEHPQLNPNIVMDLQSLIDMHKQYGGNAKAMEILRSAVQQDNGGNLQAYWERNREDLLRNPGLENLVVEQFKRLQETAPNAYTLLCRLGCYRYQSVPTLPIDGLFCLLWNVPERRMRVVDVLKSRSLVEFRNDTYWLHPMIREESIFRLRVNTEDWKITNCKAAEFWTNRVKRINTPDDVKKALEAYYHYLEINEPEEAGNVLTKRRDSWGTDEPLGVSLYTLGFLELNISLINKIITRIKSSFTLCSISNILGDSYWLSGQLNKAIKEHKKSREIAAENFTLKSYKVVSLLNIGLCKIDSWEIEEAIGYFEKFLIEAQNETFERYVKEAQFCLALLNSFLGNLEKAYQFAEEAYSLIDGSIKLMPGNLGMSKWSLGYCFLFLGATYKNLRDTQRSFDLFQGAISFAEETDYPQVKAKALIGLAELYRDQQDFEKSLSHHSESIELLEKISAKCDLAEAYYQLGLTYQAMDEVEKGNKNFQKAIQLFREMNAPKQVERVRQSMQNSK